MFLDELRKADHLYKSKTIYDCVCLTNYATYFKIDLFSDALSTRTAASRPARVCLLTPAQALSSTSRLTTNVCQVCILQYHSLQPALHNHCLHHSSPKNSSKLSKKCIKCSLVYWRAFFEGSNPLGIKTFEGISRE